MEENNPKKRSEIFHSKDKVIPKKSLSAYTGSKASSATISCPFGTTGQLEREVVKDCTRWLREQRIMCVKLYTGGVFTGKSFAANEATGCPDYIAFDFKEKKLVWIEYKRNQGGKLSQEQKNWHAWIRACNGTVLVICSVRHLQDEWSKL